MVFTAILLLAPQERFQALAPLRIALVSAAVAVLFHVLTRLSQRRPVVSFNPAIVYVLCLVGWAIATLPFSHWPGGSLTFLLGDYLKPVVIFVLLANVIDRPSLLLRFSWGLVLISVPLALVTLKHFAAGEFVGPSGRVAGYSTGLTGNPNDMALWLNLVLPFCAALFLASRAVGARLFLAAVACLFVAAIVVTFSRAGFMTLAVIAACYFWRLRGRPERAWLLAALLLALTALPLLPTDYVERMATIVEVEDDASRSAEIRLADTKAAVRLSVRHPLIGAGIGMGALAMNEERGASWTEIHNVYLQLMVDLGLPGLLLFLLLFRYCFRATGWTAGGSAGGRAHDPLFLVTEGIRVSLAAFAVAAFFHPVAYHFYFYYIASLAVAAGAIHQAKHT